MPPTPSPAGRSWDERPFTAVTIHRDDDLAAVFGKIDAADSPRVALVALRGNHELTRRLSMRRLQRHLDLSGKDLILVTRSRELRVRAREEGLASVSHLRKVNFDRPGGGLHLGWMTVHLPSLGALLAVAVFVAAVVLGAVALFWYVPAATVTISVPAQTIGDTVDLTIETKATEVDITRGIVPGRRREVTIRRTIPGPATGVRSEGVEHAGIGLRFTNRTNRPVTVPRGSVVTATNGMGFTTGQDVVLPGRVGASGEVIALAQRPGTAGNVPAHTATILEGPLAALVSVTNPEPGEKGTDFTQTVVSESDVLFIKKIGEAYLIDTARKELEAQNANETVFIDGARIDILDARPIPAIGEPARYTEVEFTARVTMLTSTNADLRRVWEHRLRAKGGADQMLLADYAKVTVERAGTHDATLDRLMISPRVTVPAAAPLDQDGLRRALRGQSRGAAVQVIHQHVEDGPPPTVKLPGWSPWLPRRESRINLVIQPAPPATAGR